MCRLSARWESDVKEIMNMKREDYIPKSYPSSCEVLDDSLELEDSRDIMLLIFLTILPIALFSVIINRKISLHKRRRVRV